jgi:hypothetical protein
MIFIVVKGGSLRGCYTNVQDEVELSIKVIDYDEFIIGENCISDLTPEWNIPAIQEIIDLEWYLGREHGGKNEKKS